jgi:acyl-CoA dehydrogenase
MLNCFEIEQWAGAVTTPALQETIAMRNALRSFVAQEISPFAHQWDELNGFPRELYGKAAQVGLLGLGYPERVGGTPCSTLSKLMATIELAQAGSGGVSASLMTHTIMLTPILNAAAPAVADEVAKQILAGAAIGALAVTESGGGSDVARLTTRAHAVAGGWQVNGQKLYITSGMRTTISSPPCAPVNPERAASHCS